MSGMFDTKQDKTKRKQETALKEEKARKKSRIITVVVTVVFLLSVAVAVLINSNFLRRTLTVVTIDGVGFNTAEFEYYYNNEYMAIASEFQSQGWEFFLPDRSRPLSVQLYDEESGQTWADIITNGALNRMTELVAVYKAAQADGFVMPEEKLAELLDSAFQMDELYAMVYGYPSVDSYLQSMYGVGMNSKIYREILEFNATVEEYAFFIHSSFSYTDNQLDEHYAEFADSLDVFTYRAFVVNYEEPEEGVEEYGTALEEAINVARETAQAIALGIETEEDFISAAYEENMFNYPVPESTLREMQGTSLDDYSYLDFNFSTWLREAGRVEGDVTTIDLAQGTAVVYFISREDNSYRTVGMRQILIMRESISASDYTDGELDPDYIEAMELAAEDARVRAELADSLFTDAGRTEDALIELMEEHSDDTTVGGFYENISKLNYQGITFNAMRVVPELEEWLFADGRAVGDSLLIETEAYGYHLLYFTGFGNIFAREIADDRMREADSSAWLENLTYEEPILRNAFILVST